MAKEKCKKGYDIRRVLKFLSLSKKVNSSLKCKTKCKFRTILEYISSNKKHLNLKNKSRRFVCARLNSTFLLLCLI